MRATLTIATVLAIGSLGLTPIFDVASAYAKGGSGSGGGGGGSGGGSAGGGSSGGGASGGGSAGGSSAGGASADSAAGASTGDSTSAGSASSADSGGSWDGLAAHALPRTDGEWYALQHPHGTPQFNALSYRSPAECLTAAYAQRVDLNLCPKSTAGYRTNTVTSFAPTPRVASSNDGWFSRLFSSTPKFNAANYGSVSDCLTAAYTAGVKLDTCDRR